MPDLSPAAQAMMDAADEVFRRGGRIRDGHAAALRAAADQVVPEGYTEAYDCCLVIMQEIRHQLLAIAAEMEAQ